jgi:putative transposase
VIRDEDDLNNHFDYIHWNPVKHRLVLCSEDWAQSTSLRWRKRGYYELNWGRGGEPSNIEDMHME